MSFPGLRICGSRRTLLNRGTRERLFVSAQESSQTDGESGEYPLRPEGAALLRILLSLVSFDPGVFSFTRSTWRNPTSDFWRRLVLLSSIAQNPTPNWRMEALELKRCSTGE